MGPLERELLLDAFDSNWIAPLGPHVDAFEREFCEIVGVPHVVALSSGTASLHLALLMLGVGPGDEVIVSTFTFAASANVVAYLGAVPVFIDSDRETWNMDPGLLAEELASCAKRGKLPKAAIVVDLYGQCADYEPILAACAEYGVLVVEDAAEALGPPIGGNPRDRLARCRYSLLTGTRSSRRPAEGCWRRRTHRSSRGHGTSRPRHAIRPRTTSTARWGTTIG